MGALLSTLAGHHSSGEVAEEALGQQKPQEAPSTSATAPSTPALAALTRVDCCLRPGQPCVKMWKCKMRQGSKKTKGVLHAFPAYICFHPRGSSSSSSITQIDLAGVDDIGITTKHAKHYVFLLTPMGRTYFRGVSGSEVKDCHLVLSTLWAGLRGHLPVAALTRSQQPSFVRASSDDLNKLQQIGRLEGEYGMRAHPELPDVMAAIFLRAKQTTDLLRAYGYSPNVPTTVNKTDTILPVSLSSFWRAFASQRWQDWPTVFLPTGRWRVKVGEWRIDGVGRSRQVVFTAKPPKNQSGTEEACVGTIAATQLACLVVNRKSLETRIHIAVVSTNNGNEYPKAKEWFELVDISRDKGFPLLQILDYRWHEEAPTPLAAPHTSA